MTTRRLVGRGLLAGLAAGLVGALCAPPGQAQEVKFKALGASLLRDNDHASFMKVHNDARKAAGLGPLTWSDELADYAGQWLDESSKGYHSDVMAGRQVTLKHRPRDGGKFTQKYGENISYWGGTGNVSMDAGKAAESWLREKAAFDKLNADPSKPYVVGDEAGKKDEKGRPITVGHYTQMVWKNSTKVGARLWYLKTTEGGVEWTRVFVVANYDAPGNYTGQKPY